MKPEAHGFVLVTGVVLVDVNSSVYAQMHLLQCFTLRTSTDLELEF